MIEIQRILCPIDFSDFSRHALDHAAAVARAYDATITLFHVCSVVPVAAYAPGAPMPASVVLTSRDREELLASMGQFAEIEAGSSVPVELEIGEGDPAEEILTRAMAISSDLLVMGTHGRSGFERFLLGSVTEKVLRKAACPVLSVPRKAPDAVPALPGLFKRIVCAVDFSDCSMHALNYAISLAQEASAELMVLHVIEVPSAVPPGADETTPSVPRRLQDYISAATEDRRARLLEAVPESVRAYCAVDTVVATGKPSREILRVATDRESDLIVIGIHGRGAADLFFVGSTAQRVVREASCPVLTLRRG